MASRALLRRACQVLVDTNGKHPAACFYPQPSPSSVLCFTSSRRISSSSHALKSSSLEGVTVSVDTDYISQQSSEHLDISSIGFTGSKAADEKSFDPDKFMKELGRKAGAIRGPKHTSSRQIRLQCLRQTCANTAHSLHVNPVNGFAACTHCHASSYLKTAKDYRSFAEDCSFFQDRSEEILSRSLALSQLSDAQLQKLKASLGLHVDISKDTLELYNVRSTSDHSGLLFPRYLSSTSIAGADHWAPDALTSCSSGLFGFAAANDRVVVLTNNVLDALAVSEGTGYATLALPQGGGQLPVEVLPYLEKFRKIILWFPSDGSSWQKAKKFVEKLGMARCAIVRTRYGSPTQSLTEGREEMAEALQEAPLLASHSVETFSMLRKNVYDSLLNVERSNGVKWGRLALLNDHLKGFRPGELTVLTGPTGSGKTTFLSYYSLDLCEAGVNTLWGSFEITNERLVRTMLTQYADEDLSATIVDWKNSQPVTGSKSEECPRFTYFANRFQDNLSMYFMKFSGPTKVDAVRDTIRSEAYLHDIGHVIIDNLQFMMGSSFGGMSEKFHEQDRLFSVFRHLASELQIHITLVMHPRKEHNSSEWLSINSIYGGVKASQEADNVLILQAISQRAPPYGLRLLQIVKNRYAASCPTLKLSFHDPTSRYQLVERPLSEELPEQQKQKTKQQ